MLCWNVRHGSNPIPTNIQEPWLHIWEGIQSGSSPHSQGVTSLKGLARLIDKKSWKGEFELFGCWPLGKTQQPGCSSHSPSSGKSKVKIHGQNIREKSHQTKNKTSDGHWPTTHFWGDFVQVSVKREFPNLKGNFQWIPWFHRIHLINEH